MQEWRRRPKKRNAMKNEQQEQAQELFFNTNMSKTEIAATVGVNRRTVLLWSKQNNWDNLRRSARHVPSIITEKCYYLLNSFADSFLIDGPVGSHFNLKHAQTIHLLASSIKKLKNRSTTNESMEMFGFFVDQLKKKDPGLADKIIPEVEEYISGRASWQVNDFLLDGFDGKGGIPFPAREQEEHWADEKESIALAQDFEEFVRSRNAAPPYPAPYTGNTEETLAAESTTEESYNNKAA